MTSLEEKAWEISRVQAVLIYWKGSQLAVERSYRKLGVNAAFSPMAHKKAGGSSKNLRDSNPQYLGTKVGDGETVRAGMVLVRQRGTKIHPGKNVKVGKDDTLYAVSAGVVKFTKKVRRRFDGNLKKATYANIIAK